MVAVSIAKRARVSYAQHNMEAPKLWTYLGIVTPAFSQAWIKAEPAVNRTRQQTTNVLNRYARDPSKHYSPSIETFLPSEITC